MYRHASLESWLRPTRPYDSFAHGRHSCISAACSRLINAGDFLLPCRSDVAQVQQPPSPPCPPLHPVLSIRRRRLSHLLPALQSIHARSHTHSDCCTSCNFGVLSWFAYRGDGGNPGGHNQLEAKEVTHGFLAMRPHENNHVSRVQDRGIIPALHLARIALQSLGVQLRVASRSSPGATNALSCASAALPSTQEHRIKSTVGHSKSMAKSSALHINLNIDGCQHRLTNAHAFRTHLQIQAGPRRKQLDTRMEVMC